MRSVIPYCVGVVLLGCAETPRANEARPFKEVCENLPNYPQQLRKRFITDLSKGVMPQAEADYQRWDVLSGTMSPSIPNWVDLVKELLERSQHDVLIELMKERAFDELQYKELAEILVARKDPDVFWILMSHAEPIEKTPQELSDKRGLYLRSAASVLSMYLGGAPEERTAVRRLIEVMQKTYWATARGTAARSLGHSDLPEAVEALLGALTDKDNVLTANGPPETTVATCAEQALEEIERRTGRPIPRVAP